LIPIIILLIIFSSTVIFSSTSFIKTTAEVYEIANVEVDFDTEDVVYDWLVMVYLDGDNDLEVNAIDDLNEMEEGIGTSNSICVIVLIDRASGYDTSNDNWDGTRLYNVTSDSDPLDINSNLLEDFGELNMGSGATLELFMDYCFANYTANHYWLNIWDHGGGIDGICWDDDSFGDALTIEEMQVAIESSTTTYGKTFDIISHDACYMNQIEVAYEYKDYTDYFVASEESVPLEGFDYNAIHTQLEANPTMNAATLCGIIVDTYETFYTSISYTTLSALNLSLIDSITTYTNQFATNLTDAITAGDGAGINEAFQNTLKFYDAYNVDFKHFIEEILLNATLMTNYPDLLATATALNNNLTAFIVDNYQESSYSGDANGVTIFMPIYSGISQIYIDDYLLSQNEYADIDWVTDTQWDEFLDEFYDAGFGVPDLGYEELALDVSTGTQSVSGDEDIYYQILFTEYSVYEFSMSVLSGDVDLYLLAATDLGSYIGYSRLWNPDDSGTETIRIHLAPGLYVVNVYGYTAGQYSLTVSNVGPTPINLEQTVTGSGGTYDGSGTHYEQILGHYYIITLTNTGTHTFTLTYDSSVVDYDLILLDINYVELDSSETTDDEDSLTTSISIETTFIIWIFGYSGYGSFSFIVTGPPTTPSFTFPGFTLIIGVIGLIAVGFYLVFLTKKKIS
jgi:hypothetical protein